MTRKLHRSCITTEDGTTIIVDPDAGTVSARTREEAEAELQRLKSLKEAGS